MSPKQFIAALIADPDGWILDRQRKIRHKTIKYNRLDDIIPACPIIHEANKTGGRFINSRYHAAARHLGLPTGFVDTFVNATDSGGYSTLVTRKARALRAFLLRNLKFTE